MAARLRTVVAVLRPSELKVANLPKSFRWRGAVRYPAVRAEAERCRKEYYWNSIRTYGAILEEHVRNWAFVPAICAEPWCSMKGLLPLIGE